MVADCLTISRSDSAMLSVLSELAAARIVMPFKIVTTSSVLRLVVKNVLSVASFY